MGDVTLDRQHATEICGHCQRRIAVSRGSVYEDGQPCGLYLAGMHHCGADRVAILALALLPPGGGSPQAVHLRVQATEEAFEMVFLEPRESPWGTHHYLGRMLTPAEARDNALREQFFHVADHVVEDLPEVRAFLTGQE